MAPGCAYFLRIAELPGASGVPALAVFRSDSSVLFKIPTGLSLGGTFSRDGSSLSLGASNGTVVVANLPEISRQLARFGIAEVDPQP
jgi:hypothetical protein